MNNVNTLTANTKTNGVNLYTDNFSGENMNESVLNLLDIPDLSDIVETRTESEPIADGWYEGTFLAKREFTDNNGNDRVFESSDTPAQKEGRNIRLQIELKRRSDGRTINVSSLIHYRPEDLTAETIAAIAQRRKEQKESGAEWKELFRPFMTLQRLSKLQTIAGVRQLQRNAEGGLDLTPVYGKKAYFKLRPDSRNQKYKEVADFQIEEPKRVPVL